MNRPMSDSAAACLSALGLALCGTSAATASEGAASNYFPGGYGNLLVGVPPDPGGILSNLYMLYFAEADRAVLQGRANIDVELEAATVLFQGMYVWDAPAIGGRFAIGGYVPLGYASLDATITSQTATQTVSGDEFGLGDIGIIPASFYWSRGKFSLNLYELIFAPTGQYDVNQTVNIGRNYWSFDTVAALTWFNPESGTEISFAPGIMFNTENPDTDYKTGTEFHAELIINQAVSDSFSVGVHAYVYDQIEGDSGAGAIFGDFESRSQGFGLDFSWIPQSANGRFVVSGTWIHDTEATNRIEADYATLTFALTF